MKKLTTQLNILYQIHRIFNDGKLHTVPELSRATWMNERHLRRYIKFLKKLVPGLRQCLGKGYIYRESPVELKVSESFVYSEVAKEEARKRNKEKRRELNNKYGFKAKPSLSKVLIPLTSKKI